VQQALADQKAGQFAQAVGDTMDRAASAYEAALAADHDDMLIRVEYSSFLVSYARVRPQSNAAARAMEVALAANALAPHDVATVVAMAKAYSAAGRTEEALKAAALARGLSPAYAMQTLGTLGLGGSTTP